MTSNQIEAQVDQLKKREENFDDLGIFAYQVKAQDLTLALGEGGLRATAVPGLWSCLVLLEAADNTERKYKECVSNKIGELPEEDKLAITKALGEILLATADLATDLGISLVDVAQVSLDNPARQSS